MFLRRRGHRIDLLHSVRDGRGMVGHRRLFQFLDVADLSQHLPEERWQAWVDEIAARCPDLKPDGERLRRQAESLVATAAEHSSRHTPALSDIRTACRLLLRAARRPDLLQAAGAEFRELQQALGHSQPAQKPEPLADVKRLAAVSKSLLSGSRCRLDCDDPRAAAFCREADELARSLESRGKVAESVQVRKEVVNCCANPSSLAAYGAALLRAGRAGDAIKAFERMPAKLATRHYHLAAAHWMQGSFEAAIDRLLDGFVRDREVAESLLRKRMTHSYWTQFGDLWSHAGREFFVRVYQPLSVRWALSKLKQHSRTVRRLLPEQARKCLSERLQLSA